MNPRRVRGCVALALMCAASNVAAGVDGSAAVQVIDLSSGISSIERLKIDTDPTLMTSISTDWEISLDSPGDADENSHALLCHNGKLYTYTNRYGATAKADPLIRVYDTEDASQGAVEQVIPFSKYAELWNANSLLNHTVAVDDDGLFLFVFGEQRSDRVILATYAFETNSVDLLGAVAVAGGLDNMNNSSLSFCDGTLTGRIADGFVFTFNILTTVGSNNYTLPITITSDGGTITASRQKPGTGLTLLYDYGPATVNYLQVFRYNVADICEIDDEHMVVSHLLDESFAQTDRLGRISLFEFQDGEYVVREYWDDDALMPGISKSDNGKGDCFGIYSVKHDGHNLMVYAQSYIGAVSYNIVKWDNPTSFANMELIGRINVPGSVSACYEAGIRQIVVQEKNHESAKAAAGVDTKDYYAKTVFYTYAPGAALARHSIVTEEDKIYTALAETSAGRGLRVCGRTVTGVGDTNVIVYDACGNVVAAYEPAKEISLDLAPGLYIVKNGRETVKVIL